MYCMNVKYDQHFLTDKNVLNLIIECSDIKSDDIVFEIGCGKGVLSREILSKKPKKLICIECDRNLNPNINDDNFELIYGDGLDEIDKHDFNKLIANIPYSITEPLYTKILDLKIVFAVMLCGFDFYKNLSSRDTKWKYFVNAFYDVKLITQVLGNKFNPLTKVKSAVVKLELKEKVNKEDYLFQKLWERRYRNTYNAIVFSLVDLFNISKSNARELVNKFNLSDKVSKKILDSLSNEEFIQLVKCVFKFVKFES